MKDMPSEKEELGKVDPQIRILKGDPQKPTRCRNLEQR